MNGMPRIAMAVLCAVVSVSVHADLTGSFKTITLDGNLADWSNPGDVIYDSTEIGAGTPAASSYDDLYLANDAANLYFGLDTSGAGGGDVSNAWTRNIYMDTDMGSGTGFNGGWMANGYDHLIQYGIGGTSYSVFEFVGAAQSDWAWNWLGLVTYAYNDDVAELSAPLSMLGVSGGDDMKVTFNVTGTGGAETWAASWEGASETYTVAVPEPATFSMLALFGGAALYIRRRMMV